MTRAELVKLARALGLSPSDLRAAAEALSVKPEPSSNVVRITDLDRAAVLKLAREKGIGIR